MKGNSGVLIKVLNQYILAGAEENHEEPQESWDRVRDSDRASLKTSRKYYPFCQLDWSTQ